MKASLREPFGHIREIPSDVKPWNAVLTSHPRHVGAPIQARVAVVGSGVAAAVLTYELSKAGADVDIYESEERIGGRIHTIRFDNSQYGELGAMRVPSNHVAVIDYIKELEIPTRPFINWNSEGIIYFGGTYLTITPAQGKSDQHYQSIKSVFPNISRHFYDVIVKGIHEAFQILIVDKILEKFDKPTDSIDILFPPNLRNKHIKEVMETKLDDFATGPDCNLSEEEWFLLSRVSGMAAFNTCTLQQFILGILPVIDSHEIYEIVGGASTLIETLFRRSKKANFHTQCMVTTLKRRPNAVDLSYVDSQSNTVVTCEYDHIVITAPPKSLRKISISSDRSALNTKKAIEEFTIRPLLKVLFNFKSNFWGDRQGLIPTDLPVAQVWYPSRREDEKDSNVLVAAYRWADLAIEWMDLPESKLIDISLESLSKLHDISTIKLRSLLKDTVVVKWPEAYTLLEASKFDRLHEIMNISTKDARIHYAGEHTNLLHGWIISSVMPAQQTARKIIEAS